MLERLELLLAAEVQRMAEALRALDEPIEMTRAEANAWRVAHPVYAYVPIAFRRLQAVRVKLAELQRE